MVGDCDDSELHTAPGFDELCDNQDNDCDTEIDESPVDGSTFFADTDKDGFGNSEVSEQRCASSDGWVDNDLDCDDSNEDGDPQMAPRSAMDSITTATRQHLKRAWCTTLQKETLRVSKVHS